MKRAWRFRWFLVVLGVAAVTAGGCAEGPVRADPKVVAEFRNALLLADEPTGGLTPLDWLDATAEPSESDQPAGDKAEEPAESPLDDDQLVLVGQIGGMPNPWPDAEEEFPWRTGEATFFLVDPSTVAEFEAHAGEEGDDHAANCPFCAREAARKASSVAAVSFVDESGAPITIGARELLGVEAGDVVVVRGKPRETSGDLLVVDADGVFIRR